MNRRAFITLLGGAAIAWPIAARAQQTGKVWRIGILGASLNVANMAAQYQAFLAELKALGFEEGKNLTINYARVDDPRGPFVAAAQLLRSPVDLVWANGPEVAFQAGCDVGCALGRSVRRRRNGGARPAIGAAAIEIGEAPLRFRGSVPHPRAGRRANGPRAL